MEEKEFQLKIPFYFNVWFIVPLIILISITIWPLVIAPIVLLILRSRSFKKQYKVLMDSMLELKRSDYFSERYTAELLSQEIASLKVQLAADQQRFESNVSKYSERLKTLDTKYNAKFECLENDYKVRFKKLDDEYVELDEKVLYQKYGIYVPEYFYDVSEKYQDEISKIIESEKRSVKANEAFVVIGQLTYGGSLAKGKQVQKKSGKLLVRSFNGECEEAILKVTPSNYESKKKKIELSFKQLNKLEESSNVAISNVYKSYKLKKLDLMLQYKLLLEEEKEKAKEERERLKEEEKVLKEIKLQQQKLEIEVQRFTNQLKNYELQLKTENDESLRSKIQLEMNQIKSQLNILEDEEKNLEFRANNTRAGYVYIISNIGAFGENVYKIGMTRRLVPDDRVKELSNASVPFSFDKHALIFSDDAYGLERSLHELFNARRVNKINFRKEYFNVNIDEIKKAVHDHFNGTVEFITDAKAIEYRETLALMHGNLEV